MPISSLDDMRGSRESPQLFGDVLALARLSWVRQMSGGLARLGYPDYRRSDALVFRHLLQGPAPIGRLGAAMGVTRQAARKVVDGLEEREYATTERDEHDGRRLNVVLTFKGSAYARAVVEVIGALNRELVERVDPDRLATATAVLQQVINGGRSPGPRARFGRSSVPSAAHR